MMTNFQQILKISADALSLKYSLDFAVLYWQEDQAAYSTKAQLNLDSANQTAKSTAYTLSQSMISAIRKPLVVRKADADSPRIQIIIPLTNDNRKMGMMVFWGKTESDAIRDMDRRFLDMIGFMALKVLLKLEEGLLIAADQQNLESSCHPVGQTDHRQREDRLDSVNDSNTYPANESSKSGTQTIGTTDQFGAYGNRSSAQEGEGLSHQLPIDLLLDLAGLGFLPFSANGGILNESPLLKPDFFGESISDRTALQILFEWGSPSNAASASFDPNPDYASIIDLMGSVFSRITDVDLLKELLPAEIRLNDKTYGLSYHYQKVADSVENDFILAVFKDISREKGIMSQYQREQERTNMVIKVALDVDGYEQFRRMTEDAFRLIETELTKPSSEIQLELIQEQLQTIQGGAEIYEINEITIALEQLLAKVDQKFASGIKLTSDQVEKYSAFLDEIKEQFQLLQKGYLNNLVSDEKLLGKEVYRVTRGKIDLIRQRITDEILQNLMVDLASTFEKNYKPFTRLKSLEDITQKRLERIKEHIESQVVEQGANQIGRIMSDFRKQPIGLILKRYAMMAVHLGERINKRVEVDVKGAEIEVLFHGLEYLFTQMTFIIRNSVEHGLEPMEERIALKKSLEGKISINAAIENNLLVLKIADDGRGIDVEKIKRAAIDHQLITQAEAAESSDQQILNLLFTKGFSTKKELQGTFGRGVGLNAVGSSVAKLGGEIKVKSVLQEGTSIEIKIPLEEVLV